MKARELWLLLLLAGCDAGTAVSVGQNQQQSVNEPNADCNRTCQIQTDGRVTVSEDCQGGATTVTTALSLPPNCTRIEEVQVVASSPAPAAVVPVTTTTVAVVTEPGSVGSGGGFGGAA